jgi:hypothetical protein
MTDDRFDEWLAALEKVDGCKENAVREYVKSLRAKDTTSRSIVDDAVFLLEHKAGDRVTSAFTQRSVNTTEWLARAREHLNG